MTPQAPEAATAARTQQTGTGLRRDAIGLREVVFQSLTDMAPGAAIAATIPARPPSPAGRFRSRTWTGVAGWMIIGVIYLIYLYNRDPRRITEVGLVHLDVPTEPSADAASRS